MPLPLFIPVAIFLGSVLFGGKKAYDAWDANSKAKVRNKEAEDLINQAKYEASFARERLRTRLETLGRKRFMIQKGLFSSFYRTFAKIRNFDKRDLKLTDEPLIQPFDIDEVKVATLAFEKVAGGLVGGLTAGAALAYGTYGAVGLLASASTGTAIGTLSGAAATNATLAWLGGGKHGIKTMFKHYGCKVVYRIADGMSWSMHNRTCLCYGMTQSSIFL